MGSLRGKGDCIF